MIPLNGVNWDTGVNWDRNLVNRHLSNWLSNKH